MGNEIEQPDPAAVFTCALSFWHECTRDSRPCVGRVNFSECSIGGDEFMRVVMRVGTKFEQWACSRIAFAALEDVWPCVLEEEFGTACIALLGHPLSMNLPTTTASASHCD